MPGSNRFTQAIDLLTRLIQAVSFKLPATNGGDPSRSSAADLGKGLEGIVQSLPGEELSLSAVTTKADPDDPTKWSLSGTPGANWPVPGFPTAALELDGSKAVLKVTDQGSSKDCKFEVGFTGKINLGISCPVAMTLSEGGKYQVVLGDAKGGLVKIDPVSLAEKIDVPGLSETLKAVSQLIRLEGVGLITATVGATLDAKTQKNTVTGVTILGSLTFAGVVVQLQIAVAQGADGKLDRDHPSVTVTWPSADDPDSKGKSIALSAILQEMGAPFTLPAKLDTKLKSFSLAHQYIGQKDQLHPKDARRIVLQSPSGKSPDLLIVGSFDKEEKKRVTVRLGWGDISLSRLPLVGDHLPGKFTPLLMLLVSQSVSIKEYAKLCSMKDFAGLETLGTPEDKLAKAPPLDAGVHCAGMFVVSGLLDLPFHFPLYVRKAKKPALLTDDDALAESGQATPVQVQRSVSPVSLNSLVFKFENGGISIILNVALNTGGLSIELIGLRAIFDVSTRDLAIGVDGGMLAYSSGSLKIAGGFVRDNSGAATDWIGTALVRVGDAFSMNAAVAFSDQDPKKLFIFAYVQRQLGGPPYCYITGLAGGFGYNRSFVVPPVDKVNEFPMIGMANDLARGGTGGIPAKLDSSALWKIVSSIQKYLPPDSNGTIFVAAGLTCTSFGFINSTLLAAMIFGTNRQFVLLGSSEVNTPADAPVAHADIQVVAAVDPSAGIARIEGVLGSESYILSRDCRLTGGFAIYAWFGGDHAGDFVITFGGYHPSYDKPPHYPEVPRIGFLWKVSREVQITGWTYFALTPKCIQAGGSLSLVLDANPLRAWFHAEAHFWINWLPFFYNIRAYVDFGVSFRLDLLFCSVTITIDVSADLRMWGPSFSGHADIHLWFVSFGVDFGAGASDMPPVKGWTDFVSSFVTPKTTRMLGADPQAQSCLDIVAVNGTALPEKGTTIHGGRYDGKVLDWFIDPQQIHLTISTTVPSHTATFNSAIVDTGRADIAIYARPVTASGESSPLINPFLIISMTHESGATIQVGATALIGMVGAAIWGPPNQASAGAEMIPGITGVVLKPKPAVPEKSVAIDMEVLAFAGFDPIPVGWERPLIPTMKFDWNTYNPFQTIRLAEVQTARTAMLKDLISMGYLKPGADSSLDLSNITASQPCFMANPALCRLGTDQTGV